MSAGSDFNLSGFLRLDTSSFESNAKNAEESMRDIDETAEETADSVEKNLGDRLSSVGGSMQKIGAGMSAAITAPLALIGKRSLDAASRAEEAESKFENVFSNTETRVREFADTFADEIGRSSRTIQNQAASFGSLLAPMIDSEEQVAELSTEFTKLTQDLASFENRDPAQVQNDLQSALAGQSETVRKYGVDLSQARLKQMGLTEESSRAEEAQLRLQAIIQDTQSAQNNAAETSDSYANQTRALRASLKDARVEIGKELLPIGRDLVSNFLSPAINRFTDLDDSTQKLIVGVGAAAAALGPLLVGVGTLLTVLPALTGAAGTLGSALAVLTGPVGIAAALVGGLAFIFKDELLAVGKQLARFITTSLIPTLKRLAVDIFQNTIKPLIEEAALTFQVWADVASRVLTFIRTRFGSELAFIRRLLAVAFKAYTTIFKTVFANLAEIASIALSVLRGDFSGAFQGIGEIVANSVDAITSIAGRLVGFVRNEFDFADALFNKFESAFSSVLSAARSFIDAIISTLNEVPGVSISVDLPSIPSFDAPDTGDGGGETPSGTDSSGLLPDLGSIGGEINGSPDFSGVNADEANGVKIENLEVSANGEREGREAGQALKDELKSLNI